MISDKAKKCQAKGKQFKAGHIDDPALMEWLLQLLLLRLVILGLLLFLDMWLALIQVILKSSSDSYSLRIALS